MESKVLCKSRLDYCSHFQKIYMGNYYIFCCKFLKHKWIIHIINKLLPFFLHFRNLMSNFEKYLSWKMSNHSHSYTYCIIHVLYFTNYGLDTIIPYLWRHDDVIGREWELLPRIVENSSIMGQSSAIWNMKIRSPKS